MPSEQLTQLLAGVEKKIGFFSHYTTTAGPAQDISFEMKPAQQFLSGLNVGANRSARLSTTNTGQPLALDNNPTVSINSFDPKTPGELKLTGKRVDRLLKSAKIYLNADLISKETYTQAGTVVRAPDKGQVEGSYWQNLAVGICHSQEVDLLIEHSLVDDREAVASVRQGQIEEDAPALLLLSSPALNFGYGVAGHLTKKERDEHVKGMFRNLFQATLSEQRQYIAMPAAGLGPFVGKPELYFNALMQVAQEFPDLNIMYHPAENASIFRKILEKYQPQNVIEAHKDAMFIAHELTQSGHLCAFHNPSDSDVVYGVYDVGEYWKTGKGGGYVGEEHLGAMTTAPLNSKGLNPLAYTRVVEQQFIVKNKAQKTVIQDTMQIAPELLNTVITPLLNESEQPVVATTQTALPEETTQELEQEYKLLINKLKKLTSNYLNYLKTKQAASLVDEKISHMVELSKILDNQSGPGEQQKPSGCVAQFYQYLDKAESKLKAHRSPDWKRYVQNALAIASILISGILPGLLALSIYRHSGNTAGKSLHFWHARGENVVEALKDLKEKVNENNLPKNSR